MYSDFRHHNSNATIDDCPIFLEAVIPDTTPILSYIDPKSLNNLNQMSITPTNSIKTISTNQNLSNIALCVDDSSLNRKFIGRFLEKYFSKVHYCVNGLEAVEYMEKSLIENLETISIIFMDNVMPVMDGLEATTKIRNLGYTGPIVGVTGNCLPEQIDEFLGHGASVIIQKPVTLETFGKIVCDVMGENAPEKLQKS